MKSAFKGVIFWIGQKDVEVQLSANKGMVLSKKCEEMQAGYAQKLSEVENAYTEKLKQVHTGYQKAMKKIQAMDQERESLLKDKKELQEKYTQKSRYLVKLYVLEGTLYYERSINRRLDAVDINLMARVDRREQKLIFKELLKPKAIIILKAVGFANELIWFTNGRLKIVSSALCQTEEEAGRNV